MKAGLRIIFVFALVWCISRSAVFLLPGDPVEFLVHDSLVQVSPETLRSKMDLNATLMSRIFSIPKNQSLIRAEPASLLLKKSLSRSLILTLITLMFAIPLSFTLLYLHFTGGSGRLWSNRIILFLTALPTLVIGPLILRTLNLPNPILPALTLALSMTAFWTRALSAKIDELLPVSSVQGARALGYPEFKIFVRDLLAPSLGGFIAYFGTQLGILLNGSLIVEALFQWGGLGSLIVDSVLSRDYPVIEMGIITASLLTLTTQQIGYSLQKYWEPQVQ
jgi:ABC-type dipeptide/oligopeptide/nickel transport system permease component